MRNVCDPEIDRMPAETIADLLLQMIPIMHGAGQDHYVEALSEALDIVRWQHLSTAPRDGTWVVIAVAPAPRIKKPGFVSFGRWVAAEEIGTPEQIVPGVVGKDRRTRIEQAGGWWTNSRHLKPLSRPVVAWRPAPAMPISLPFYDGDLVTGCADDAR